MAALLVALGVMAVLMSAALPVWRHEMQREKEAELIFRGESYARAIALYQRKAGPGVLPPTIDALVQGRFLRKKYKDPMVEDGEFFILYPGQQSSGPQGQLPGSNPGRGPGGTTPGRTPTAVPPPARGAQPASQPQFSNPGTVSAAGIMGVRSKSTETSIRVYRGMNHYNEWQFIAQTQTAPGGGPQRGAPGGGPGGRPGGPGGIGPGGGPPGRPGGPGRGFNPGGPGVPGQPPPGRRGGGG